MLIEVPVSKTGKTTMTSRNTGINQNAVKVYEFTATAAVVNRQ